jgi:hypothetical protein
MVALKRSRLPPGAQRVEADLWVSKGRAYRKVNSHYVCEGVYFPPRKNRKGKLSEEDAAFIKAQINAGANQQWLREKFDVSAVTIHNIGRGNIWKNIEASIMELEGPPKGVHRVFWDEHISYEEMVALDAKLEAKKAATKKSA